MKADSWIKAGGTVLVVKYNPYRYNPLSDVLASAKEAVIEKVGIKYLYTKGGATFDRQTLASTGSLSYGTRIFRDRDHVIEFYEMQEMKSRVEGRISKASPEQVKAIHAILFPEKV